MPQNIWYSSDTPKFSTYRKMFWSLLIIVINIPHTRHCGDVRMCDSSDCLHRHWRWHQTHWEEPWHRTGGGNRHHNIPRWIYVPAGGCSWLAASAAAGRPLSDTLRLGSIDSRCLCRWDVRRTMHHLLVLLQLRAWRRKRHTGEQRRAEVEPHSLAAWCNKCPACFLHQPRSCSTWLHHGTCQSINQEFLQRFEK